jgi:hypothetical protein
MALSESEPSPKAQKDRWQSFVCIGDSDAVAAATADTKEDLTLEATP